MLDIGYSRNLVEADPRKGGDHLNLLPRVS